MCIYIYICIQSKKNIHETSWNAKFTSCLESWPFVSLQGFHPGASFGTFVEWYGRKVLPSPPVRGRGFPKMVWTPTKTPKLCHVEWGNQCFSFYKTYHFCSYKNLLGDHKMLRNTLFFFGPLVPLVTDLSHCCCFALHGPLELLSPASYAQLPENMIPWREHQRNSFQKCQILK
jgi:hypothetical protein